jgi:FkbM family methyltransferase
MNKNTYLLIKRGENITQAQKIEEEKNKKIGMFNKISILKDKNYYPDTIFDIGAHHGKWTKDMLKIYDQANYLLFEAIDYPELKETIGGFDKCRIFNVLLNDKIDTVKWYEMKNTGDSMFKEKSIHFDFCSGEMRNTIDLDSFLEKENINNLGKVFIKIDCQGAEIPILKGAGKLIEGVDFILLEIPLFGQYNEGVPNFLEHIQYMNSIGFIIYDILESHYVEDFNRQVDILFINKNHEFNKLV